MNRYRLSTFIEADHHDRIGRLAARTGLSKSEIVAAAIGSYLSPDGGDKREAALAARLDRLGRQYERIERDQTILIETVALFVRHTLTVTAPIPAAHQEAAVAQGRERFRQFVEQLARRLQQDRSLVREVHEEIFPDASRYAVAGAHEANGADAQDGAS